MPREVYKCENCDKEFDTPFDCADHEVECLDKDAIVKIEFEKTLTKLKEKYGLVIITRKAEVWVDDDISGIVEFVDVNLSGLLPNGITVRFEEEYWKFDDFIYSSYQRLEEEAILPYLNTKYEGKVWGNNGYECDYMIDDLEISEICRRLHGKKVRIEVIE
ncbi:hypothetical protein SAMN04487895_101595 [Paenibacillus sophorae]|uniref:Uncharacterized protein n=1 Tax=Paenibacillus sophorae TaxID=1333845 RepID=A0A1H8GPA2_9BACL|nr:hypothetical protein [Paenibacillus sophorae]QWU14296.1 hypothetical protein KP014_20530 [Paenibacillus sophorae]SEN45842.1 hypothetical protein SAMN04487895_101595 [Paenibacillus sophorae]